MSEIKVNKISPRTNCGTVQLGDSGDTITIPAGATINNQGTATNFGATGSASWTTTVKTGNFTAVAGEGYFVDTSSGAINVSLPAGTAGAVVAISDYANNFGTHNVTLIQNGSDKIGGATINAKLQTDGLAVTLIFIDSTKGWIVTDDGNQSSAVTAEYITATGGTISCSGDFKIHTFTSPGTFCVSNAGNADGSNTVDYLVVAGGGGGGSSTATPNGASGGGAGGFRVSNGYGSPNPLMSPLSGCVAALPVTATGYPVTVGAGGAGGPPQSPGSAGSNSIYAGTTTITSAGGGQGSGNTDAPTSPGFGGDGGSGGGSHQGSCREGSGNTPPVTPPQGNPGGGNSSPSGNGGGGAGAAGGNTGSPPNPTPYCAGDGGIGSFVIQAGFGGCNGTPGPVSSTRYFAGGGGGANSPGRSPQGTQGTGGAGGGGGQGCAGAANTGGGGGAQSPGAGSAGGSGIVIIRYKYQN